MTAAHPDPGPPERRNRPGVVSQAVPKSTATDYLHSSGDYRHQAPTVEHRAVAHAIEVLTKHGYGIALRCLDCRRPITAPASLRRMRGPRCAARVVPE
jgi:hypothetical protein